MVYDANLALRGIASGGSLVDLEDDDAVAILTSVNNDGNRVIDLKKTGVKGLIASLILIEEADATNASVYLAHGVMTIEESNYIDRNWQTVVTFPTIRPHLVVLDVTADVAAFVAGDVGQAITEETSTDSGIIIAFEDALLTLDGRGKIIVEIDAVGDVFDAALGKTENTTTGRSVKAALTDSSLRVQMMPGTYNRRFTTDKRYIRSKCTIDGSGNLGLAWILLTNDAGDSHSVV